MAPRNSARLKKKSGNTHQSDEARDLEEAPSIATPIQTPVQVPDLNDLLASKVSASSAQSNAHLQGPAQDARHAPSQPTLVSSPSNTAASDLEIVGDDPSQARRLKPLKVQPKAARRRAELEREALERKYAERHKGPSAGANRGATAQASLSSHRGRGTFENSSHWGSKRAPREYAASGVLGGTAPKEKMPRARRGGASGGSSRRTMLTDEDAEDSKSKGRNHGPDRIKREDTNVQADEDGDVIMSSPKRTRKSAAKQSNEVKIEDDRAGNLSDEARWDDESGPKLEIAQISLISDEESEEEAIRPSSFAAVNRRERSVRPSGFQLLPIRLERHEHMERQVGVNTDASSLASAELRKRAKKKEGQDGLSLPEKEAADIIQSTMAKSKGKAKDTDVDVSARPFKGVYDEDEGSDGFLEERDPMDLDTEQATAGAEATISAEAGEAARDEERKPRRVRIRRPRKSGYQNSAPPFPVAEDDEDMAEAIGISKEVQQTSSNAQPNTSRESSELKGNPRREAKVFLMQLPAVMPALRDINKPPPKVKAESGKTPDNAPSSQSRATSSKPDADASTKTPQPKTVTTKTHDAKSFVPTPGNAGELVVFESGKMIASWGGLDLEIIESQRSGFAQEVLLHDFQSTMTKVENESRWEEVIRCGEEAYSMGHVDAGFVAAPDLVSLLGP